MTSSSRPTPAPLLCCTLGDPAGIGPEILLRAAERTLQDDPSLLIVADFTYLCSLARDLHIKLDLVEVTNVDEVHKQLESGRAGPWVLTTAGVDPGVVRGHPRLVDGRTALSSVCQASDLALAGQVDALVTAPLNKQLVARHETSFRGHTEYLAARAGIQDPQMLFASNSGPHVALLTTHLPLRSAVAAVECSTVLAALRQLDRRWREAFGRAPCIAVAGLNPHAGDDGLLGVEDAEEIAPAVATARAEDVDVIGPLPADSIFRNEDADLILALYHDQGTIMAKRSASPTVNVTLGLPYPRTSPDHGTAYDIAASGTADPSAMIAALRLAARLVQTHRTP